MCTCTDKRWKIANEYLDDNFVLFEDIVNSPLFLLHHLVIGYAINGKDVGKMKSRRSLNEIEKLNKYW